MGGKLTEFLIVIELKGNRTEALKGHIIPRRITADNAQEAMAKPQRAKYLKKTLK
jgi:hypothetical protein